MYLYYVTEQKGMLKYDSTQSRCTCFDRKGDMHHAECNFWGDESLGGFFVFPLQKNQENVLLIGVTRKFPEENEMK